MNTGNGRSPTYNRVLIVENHELLGAGLEKLLSCEETLEVCGFTPQDEFVLIDEIWRFQPHTVILTAESHLTNPTRLFELLKDYSRLRIVSISVGSNIFEIYDKQQLLAHNLVSLVANLKSE